MMESTIMNGMCRCCATEGAFKDFKTAYTWMGEEEVYADMLRECFDISLSSSEHGEDGGICEVCITQLRNASNFKKQVLSTEEQFKKHALNKLFRPNIVKVEVTADDTNDTDDNLSAEEGYSGTEFEVPIKKETEEPKPKKRAAATKATTSRAKKAKTESGETSTKREEEKLVQTEKGLKRVKVIKKQPKIKKVAKKKEEKDKSKSIKSIENKPAATKKPHDKELKDVLEKNRSNFAQIMTHSNATPIHRKEDVGYFCYFCPSSFREPAALKEHNLSSHLGQVKPLTSRTKNKGNVFCIKLDITGLVCKLCNSNVDSLENLLFHLKNIHDKIIFTDVKNLIVPFKFDSNTIKCCICSSVFEKFKTLMEHMHIHYRNYVCNECELGFITRHSLHRHLETHILGTFKCVFCPKVFNTAIKKKNHQNHVHRGDNTKYKCGFCIERFTESHKKDEHLSKVHGITRQIKCRACDKTFSTKWSLTIHTRRHHLMEHKYKCTECELWFFSQTELTKHKLKHTGVKDFKCYICLKCYARKKTLTEHLRIHYNDRRFKCEHCDLTFIQKCSLKSHVKNRHVENIKSLV